MRARHPERAKYGRGFCAECGIVGKLKKDGTMHGHMRMTAAASAKYSSGPWRERCPGSGLAPSSRLYDSWVEGAT